MRTLSFANRCAKDILRDPVNLFFGLAFPLLLLLLLWTIQRNVPVSLFTLQSLTPGISVFGLSFLSLFSASLLAKDRESAFLQRLYTSPLEGRNFIMGYLLPLLPFALVQGLVCYLFALLLGLPFSPRMLLAVLGLLPMGLFYLSLGLLFGSVLGSKQVGGICGALLTNVSAWFSGIWFDPKLLGSFLGRLAELLPFSHGVKMEQALLSGDWERALVHLLPVGLYAAVSFCIAVRLFLRQRKQ